MTTTMQPHRIKKPAAKWQTERANRLHRKFLSLERALARGARFNDSVKGFVWFWRKRCYRNEPGRRVHFARGTIYSLFKKWRDGGRTPAALRLNFRSGYQRAPQRMLLDFLKFCCSKPRSLSLLAAWNEFVRRARVKPPVGYSAVLRYFNSVTFRAYQGELRKIANAQQSARRIRIQAEAKIRHRFGTIGGQR